MTRLTRDAMATSALTLAAAGAQASLVAEGALARRRARAGGPVPALPIP